MAKLAKWNERQKEAHDNLLGQAIAAVRNAADVAGALQGELVKLHGHAEKVTEAATGRKLSSARLKPDLHAIFQSLSKQGEKILHARGRELTEAELRKHHENLEAIIPALKTSSEHAQRIGKHLKEIHDRFRTIMKMSS